MDGQVRDRESGFFSDNFQNPLLGAGSRDFSRKCGFSASLVPSSLVSGRE